MKPVLQVWKVIKMEILNCPDDSGTEILLALWFIFLVPFTTI